MVYSGLSVDTSERAEGLLSSSCWWKAFLLLTSILLLLLSLNTGQAEGWCGDVEALAQPSHWIWIGQKKWGLSWYKRGWELESWPEGQGQSSDEHLTQSPSVTLRHQKVGYCRTPEDRQGLLCWEKVNRRAGHCLLPSQTLSLTPALCWHSHFGAFISVHCGSCRSILS